MRGLIAIFRRELLAYFYSPLAYVVLTTFLLVFGFLFHSIVAQLSDPRFPGDDVFPRLFGSHFTWIVVLLYCATLTMRLLAEERRTGSIEMLVTAPVRDWQIIIGKFFGAFVFYLFLWAPTLVFVLAIGRHSRLDPGPIAAGYLGVAVVGALFLAVGTFSSALTRNQVVAAIIGFSICLLIFGSGLMLKGLAADPKWKAIWSYVDLWSHMIDFGRGIVDTRRLVFHLSGTVFFLYLATRVLELRRWR